MEKKKNVKLTGAQKLVKLQKKMKRHKQLNDITDYKVDNKGRVYEWTTRTKTLVAFGKNKRGEVTGPGRKFTIQTGGKLWDAGHGTPGQVGMKAGITVKSKGKTYRLNVFPQNSIINRNQGKLNPWTNQENSANRASATKPGEEMLTTTRLTFPSAAATVPSVVNRQVAFTLQPQYNSEIEVLNPAPMKKGTKVATALKGSKGWIVKPANAAT